MNLLGPITLFQLGIDEKFCSTMKRSKVSLCLYTRIRKKRKTPMLRFICIYGNNCGLPNLSEKQLCAEDIWLKKMRMIISAPRAMVKHPKVNFDEKIV
jgi:hypothetical protein